MDIKQSRDETLIKTIDILSQLFNDENLKKIEFKLIQTLLINDVLDKIANAWVIAGDLYNVSIYVEDIKKYTMQPFMHQYKLAELIVHLNKILHPKTTEFCLN